MPISRAQVDAQLEMISEEQDKILEKAPIWKKIAAWGVIAIALAAAIAACGALTAASGGVAIAACVGAILAVLGALVKLVIDIGDESGESSELDRKRKELEALREK